MDSHQDHHDKTIERFTQTAASFGAIAAHSSEESMLALVQAVDLGPGDTVLDVACGPGIVGCRLAQTARHVTGIDITPAMIEEAQRRQKNQGLSNLTWVCAKLPPLPFPDASFSRVVSRYALHHMIDPATVVSEMTRVCRPGGRVVVADVMASEDPEQAQAYNHVEKLRDASHTWIQPASRLEAMIQAVGLVDVRRSVYRLEIEVEEQLRESHTPMHEAAEFRRLVAEDAAKDRPQLGASRDGDRVFLRYPVLVLSAKRP